MIKRFWIFLSLAFLLGACTSSIRSDVTRFHELAPPKGETFIIVAKNPAREGSLELARYATEVTKNLIKEGYQPAGEGTPDLIVSIDFGISDPLKTESYSRPPPYFGPTFYGRRHRYYSTPYNPYYGYYYYGLGSFFYDRYSYLYDTGDYTRIVYERVFEMAIEKNGGPFVFEGRAVSLGRSHDLPKVMPLMIDALFVDFPGVDGSTVRVTVEAEK